MEDKEKFQWVFCYWDDYNYSNNTENGSSSIQEVKEFEEKIHDSFSKRTNP